jgi:hypothetical protein
VADRVRQACHASQDTLVPNLMRMIHNMETYTFNEGSLARPFDAEMSVSSATYGIQDDVMSVVAVMDVYEQKTEGGMRMRMKRIMEHNAAWFHSVNSVGTAGVFGSCQSAYEGKQVRSLRAAVEEGSLVALVADAVYAAGIQVLQQHRRPL